MQQSLGLIKSQDPNVFHELWVQSVAKVLIYWSHTMLNKPFQLQQLPFAEKKKLGEVLEPFHPVR